MPFALAGLALAWAVMLFFGGMEIDRGLLLLVRAGDHPGLAEAARWLTFVGSGRVLIALSLAGALWLVLRRDLWPAALLLAVTLSGRLLVIVQKDWAARARPEPNLRLVEVHSASFPSAHAANAAIVLVSLALLLPRDEPARGGAVWAAVVLSLAIGVSRLVLGVHWPSDVIGGWAFGLFWTLLCLRMAGGPLGAGTPARPPKTPNRG
jgi:undecaprenyl-diphosphatase